MQEYLDRIGFTGTPAVDLETLAALQRAHLSTVPFENLAVYRGEAVSTSTTWSLPKIIQRGQGGWCFELNGAFAVLLESLGFTVLRLGAAVLLDGPNRLVDHLALEVQLDEPYLVDVGFGDSFIAPLRLNDREPQQDEAGWFQLIDSAEGLTLTKLDVQVDADTAGPVGDGGAGVPIPQYRFRRVAHEMADFDDASDRLRTDRTLHWSAKPFATRLVDGGPRRVTLLKDRLKYHGDGQVTETAVAEDEWVSVLERLFR
ncbi:MAG: arylamine N-acetyltransferase [Actinomycetota bacterium]